MICNCLNKNKLLKGACFESLKERFFKWQRTRLSRTTGNKLGNRVFSPKWSIHIPPIWPGLHIYSIFLSVFTLWLCPYLLLSVSVSTPWLHTVYLLPDYCYICTCISTPVCSYSLTTYIYYCLYLLPDYIYLLLSVSTPWLHISTPVCIHSLSLYIYSCLYLLPD